MIIEHGGTTTTLCVAVVVELNDTKAGSKWGLCVVSVGDSLCYVWKSEEQEVLEVTSEMHLGMERNPRDCGGCLGCEFGDRPDLSNLTCSFVALCEHDIVFAMSDGIVDNFDPVILKNATSISQHSTPTTSTVVFPPPTDPDPLSQSLDEIDHSPTHSPKSGLDAAVPSPSTPMVNSEQRQHMLLMNLTKLLRERVVTLERKLNATDVKETLISQVIEVTEDKRKYLEECWNELDKPDLTASEKRASDRKIGQHMKQMPGKLDHATVAAYSVGRLLLTEEVKNRMERTPTNTYAMNNVVESPATTTTASGGLRKAKSFSAGGSVFYFVAQSEGPGSGGEPPVVSDGSVTNGSSKNRPLRHNSDISSVRISRQNALVTFPKCLDSSSESNEI